MVLWFGLQCLIVVFPYHTYFLFSPTGLNLIWPLDRIPNNSKPIIPVTPSIKLAHKLLAPPEFNTEKKSL